MFYPWLSSNSADVIELFQSKQVVGVEWRGEAKAAKAVYSHLTPMQSTNEKASLAPLHTAKGGVKNTNLL